MVDCSNTGNGNSITGSACDPTFLSIWSNHLLQSKKDNIYKGIEINNSFIKLICIKRHEYNLYREYNSPYKIS